MIEQVRKLDFDAIL
jgi:hypothetical protein